MPEIVGFTGTRLMPSIKQTLWLGNHLKDVTGELHHGACIGADAVAHQCALNAGLRIVVHPPTKRDRIAYPCIAIHRPPHDVTVLDPLPYLERNRAIVDASTRLIALPECAEQIRSGTWSTVRYAISAGTPVTICYPDGRTETR